MSVRPAIAIVFAAIAPFLRTGLGSYRFGMTQAELQAVTACHRWTKQASNPINTLLACDQFAVGASRWTLQAHFEPMTLQALELHQRFSSPEESGSAIADVLALLDREIGGVTSSALADQPATAAAIWDALASRRRPAGRTSSISLSAKDRARAGEMEISVSLAVDQAHGTSYLVTFWFTHRPVPPLVTPEELKGLVVQHMTLTLWNPSEGSPAARTYRAETFHETAAALSQQPAVTSNVIVTLRRLQVSATDAVDFDRPDVSTWLRLFAGPDGERKQGAAFSVPIEPLHAAFTVDDPDGASSLSQPIRIAWTTADGEHSCALPTRLEMDRRLDHARIVFNGGVFANIANCTSVPNGLTVDLAYRPAK